jgi:autophagy-related protein 16-1
VLLWDSKTGAKLGAFSGALQTINSVAFNRLSDHFLAASNDNSIKIWDVESKRVKHTLTGHLAKVTSARFAGLTGVYSGSHDRIIKFWDLVKGYCTSTLFTLSACNDVVALDSEGYSKSNKV